MEILQYEFMRNAIISATLVSIACGIVGTYVVLKKIVFITGGISHSVFGGIGLGYLLGINPILVAIPFNLLSASGIGFISKKTRISEDTSIGIVWSLGMALGVLFVNLTPGYPPDLFSYLFGNILTVPLFDLSIMALLDIIIIIIVTIFFKEFLSISFDEEFSNIVGIKTFLLYQILLWIVALSIIVLIRVVGIILLIALLTIPSTIAKIFTKSIKKIIMLSIIIGIIITLSGLWISYITDLPSGATIVIILSILFFISILSKRFLKL